jgi:hypothetical protein
MFTPLPAADQEGLGGAHPEHELVYIHRILYQCDLCKLKRGTKQDIHATPTVSTPLFVTEPYYTHAASALTHTLSPFLFYTFFFFASFSLYRV